MFLSGQYIQIRSFDCPKLSFNHPGQLRCHNVVWDTSSGSPFLRIVFFMITSSCIISSGGSQISVKHSVEIVELAKIEKAAEGFLWRSTIETPDYYIGMTHTFGITHLPPTQV